MIILGVDYGKARTGVAVCDPAELLAVPVCVISEWNQEKVASKLAELVQEKKAELLVVGLPKKMDGSEGESARNARALAAMVQQRCQVPVYMQDERGTTITAHGYLSENNVRGKKRKAVVDAAAAVIILQNHLDQRRLQKK